jgi:hypothetical protein
MFNGILNLPVVLLLMMEDQLKVVEIVFIILPFFLVFLVVFFVFNISLGVKYWRHSSLAIVNVFKIEDLDSILTMNIWESDDILRFDEHI